MEVPDEVGRALPVPENATSVRAWKFTILKIKMKKSKLRYRFAMLFLNRFIHSAQDDYHGMGGG